MATVATRPFSPREGQPFTGYFIYVSTGGQERKVVQVDNGNPTIEPVEFMPGTYSVEWIEAEKPPLPDFMTVPDEPEVELKDILNSLKGESVPDSVQEQVGEPVTAADAGSVAVSSDETVGSQPPGTEQEVAPDSVSTKRGGGKSPNA